MDGHKTRLNLLQTMARPPITSHVLDTALGKPAQGVPIRLEHFQGTAWAVLGACDTNGDGRAPGLLSANAVISPGIYQVIFDTAAYYSRIGGKSFYPEITVTFTVEDATQHYHVPLLLNPYGYSTYRGS